VNDQQKSRSRPTRKQLLWAGAAVALLSIAILIGYRYGITLWDLIQLLIVPAAIAIGAGFENFIELGEPIAQGAQTGRSLPSDTQEPYGSVWKGFVGIITSYHSSLASLLPLGCLASRTALGVAQWFVDLPADLPYCWPRRCS
jgi:hypothetical protein